MGQEGVYREGWERRLCMGRGGIDIGVGVQGDWSNEREWGGGGVHGGWWGWGGSEGRQEVK